MRIQDMLGSIKRTFLAVDSVVGRYRIIEEIDRGGMAVVYKAMQLDLKREVALKVMPANLTINDKFVERFMAEAHAVAKLNNSNIVQIYEVAVENNVYYLAMEYIPGDNLFYHLYFRKPKLADVLEIVSQLAEALSYAHAQKIIHRDLKLNNVIMRDRLCPVLIDFGLAKALEEETDTGGITRTGEIVGSPAYMAPERLLGEAVDHRSDICSLGIMLYEMLTFKNPYLDQRNIHQTANNVIESNPIAPRKLVPWLPAEIEAITLKAMAKEATNRYQSMDEFRADIQRYQRGERVLAQPPSFIANTKRFVQKRWALLVISLILFLFTGAVTTNSYLQSKKVISHLQLVYTDSFDSPESHREWTIVDASPNPAVLIDKDGLIADSEGLSYAFLNKAFNRDILITVTIAGVNNNLHNAGLFLFGSHPEEAYTIHLNRNGTGECGITYPGGSFLFTTKDAGTINLIDVNRITIERVENSLTLTINDQLISRIYDFLPPIGPSHEQVGVFVNGGVARFSDLKIYRRAIPLVPSPSIVADRFRERGAFESAIDEYKGLMIGMTNARAVEEILIKIADCKLRLGDYQGALNTIKKNDSRQTGILKAKSLLLMAESNRRLKNGSTTDSLLRLIAGDYQSSPVAFSAAASVLNHWNNSAMGGSVEETELFLKRNTLLYPHYTNLFGKLHLKILEYYCNGGRLDAATQTMREIASFYPFEHEIITRARSLMGRAYLNRGRLHRAAEMFNQCTHTNNRTIGVWEAWHSLAEIYEYDFSSDNALSIYQKIVEQSPKSSPLPWMAAIKVADLTSSDLVGLDEHPYLQKVIESPHPYPLPRLIAHYLTGQTDVAVFQQQWNRLYPGDQEYLYFKALKARQEGKRSVARAHLQELLQNTPTHSWSNFRAARILNNFERW